MKSHVKPLVTRKQPSKVSHASGASNASRDHERVRAAGLRRVAVASVVALAVVLPLAVATAGSEHGQIHRGTAGHSMSHASQPSRDDD